MRQVITALFAAFLCVFISSSVFAQTNQARYGGDFLSTGGGARALGMGSAHVAFTNDVSAAYWNVAGLASVSDPQILYMHSERFDGIVGYDYAAAALPLQSGKGVLALTFIRQGVDNIPNTLNAFDQDRNQPRENAEDFITRFSTADVAFFLSYATQRSERLSIGATAKVINQTLGPFAEAWGYSLDIGAQYRTGFADFGISVRDITTLQKMWTIDEDEFASFSNFDTLSSSTGDPITDIALPTGQNEYVLPSVKIGMSRSMTFSDFNVITALDFDLLFENRQAFYLNIGRMSIEPNLGSELTYKERVSFRAGITNVVDDPESGITVAPTVGLGLQLSAFQIDYGFASFAGAASDLGYTHRISLQFSLPSRNS